VSLCVILYHNDEEIGRVMTTKDSFFYKSDLFQEQAKRRETSSLAGVIATFILVPGLLIFYGVYIGTALIAEPKLNITTYLPLEINQIKSIGITCTTKRGCVVRAFTPQGYAFTSMAYNEKKNITYQILYLGYPILEVWPKFYWFIKDNATIPNSKLKLQLGYPSQPSINTAYPLVSFQVENSDLDINSDYINPQIRMHETFIRNRWLPPTYKLVSEVSQATFGAFCPKGVTCAPPAEYNKRKTAFGVNATQTVEIRSPDLKLLENRTVADSEISQNEYGMLLGYSGLTLLESFVQTRIVYNTELDVALGLSSALGGAYALIVSIFGIIIPFLRKRRTAQVIPDKNNERWNNGQ
jgi:hypothetical protein